MLKQSPRTSKHANDQQGWQHDSSGLYFSLNMVFKSVYRSGFCEFSGFSRWSGTSPDFKVWSTLSTKLGKSLGSSWSLLASFSSCSQALSTLLNKTDQMRTSGKTKNNGHECPCCIKQTFLFNRKFYDCILWSALTVTTVGYNLQPEVSRWSTIYCQTSQYVFDLLLEQDACPGSHSPPSRAWVSWRAGKNDKKSHRGHLIRNYSKENTCAFFNAFSW